MLKVAAAAAVRVAMVLPPVWCADVARHVLRHEGGPLGLFKGLSATLWRESLGNMAMFGVYELVKQQMVATKVGAVLRSAKPVLPAMCRYSITVLIKVLH